jgi:hypothetical protein
MFVEGGGYYGYEYGYYGYLVGGIWKRADGQVSIYYNENDGYLSVINRANKTRSYKIVIGKKWR